ncbi:DUF6950 family protein [Caulobacter vibrioides]|uniref:DUF6950 family protein n=1 Tax=Caulobacter vibrioides TaxID=155892 RepID=UPI000BB4FBCB|nr:hypothetical protein [Caulobacter vibrioides]ATC25215.1 hypothetical protein CA608_12085 [Caulobacter vibrioides]PLR13985.1 hypothetical protein CVUC_05385 [Caulobacter vibrioides]
MVRNYEALHAYVASHMRTPFAWGQHDCVLFAAGAVQAQTGEDPLRAYRGRWASERGAARVLKRLGGMEAAVNTVLQPITPAMAQRGDVAGWLDARGRLQLAIVEGETLVGPGPSGQLRLPRKAMTRAWSAMR